MNRWINVHDRLPEEDELVLAAVSGRYENVEWVDAYLLARFYPEEGWMLEEYPEAENFRITWWMKLPDDLPDADVVQTNADSIRGMRDEELAVLFSRLCHNAACCDDCPLDGFCPDNEQVESWARMLQQPHEED